MNARFGVLVLSTFTAFAARSADAQTAQRPFGTLHEQAAMQQQWLRKRLDIFLPSLMRKHGIDMVEALSTPPNANAIVDQKITSLRSVLGTNEAAGIGVAEPYRDQESHPRTTSAPAGTQLAIAPTLFSHFPTFRPTTLRVTVRTRPAIATAVK